MMFRDTTLDRLSGEEVYKFPRAMPVYRAMIEFLDGYFSLSGISAQLKDADPERKVMLVWAVMNEGWWLFGRVNPEVPVRWLALAKKLLELRLVPSNVFSYCEAIVGNFDLQRYQGCYHLPVDEFLALSNDLFVVKQKLHDFPRNELLPSIPESDWEDHDCVPPA